MTALPSQETKTHMLPIRRPVATAMVFLTLVVFGWKSYQQLPINLMPDISYPTLTVRTEFEGAAPEDVEELLTRPLEENLSTVSNLIEVSSVSSPGVSEIILEFAWDTDMDVAQQDVRDRLDLYVPPREVTEKPVILRYDPKLDPVMRVAVTGSDLSDISDAATREERMRQELTLIREAAERHIKSDLEAQPGIAQVLVKGGREEEIQISLDSARLKNLGLSPLAVVSALSQQNINLSAGMLREGRTEYLVRTLNEFVDVDEIPETVIVTPTRRQIRLRDVATVTRGEKDPETLVRINGNEAVELAFFKWGDANTVEVCNTIKDLLGFERKRTFSERLGNALSAMRRPTTGRRGPFGADYAKELAKTVQSHVPEFASMTIISDQSAFILAAIEEVRNTAILGSVLALIVLFFFLRELRTTVIVGVAIPVSIISTFLPMFMRDISLNIMSLGGIALGVGMLVDNSIVVLESIFRCAEEGDNPVDAADRGTREVFGADAAATLTTVAVFLPIAFVEGVAGQLFGDLAVTVTFSLLASLLVALYLVPMLAAKRRLASLGPQNVVWMRRAYHEAREAGHGPLGALFLALPFYLPLYTVRWLRNTGAGTFAPGRQALRNCVRPTGRPLYDALRAALIPLALLQFVLLGALFVLHTALKSITTVFISLFFLTCLGITAVVWGIRWILRGILWIPLRLFDAAFQVFRENYTRFLRRVLPLGPAVLLVTAVLTVHAGYLATRLGRELIPPLKQGEFGIRMEAAPGTRLDETAHQAQVIEELARAMPEIETVTVAVGQEKTKTQGERGENIAQFTIRLKNPGETAPFQQEIMDRLRTRVLEKTANEVTFTLPTLFSFKTAVELQIRGEDLRGLKALGLEVLDALEGIEGIKDTELSMREGYPEVIIELDRDLLASRGISPEQVAQLLRTEVQGDIATRFSQPGRKIDMLVRADRQRLRSLNDLRALSIVDGHPPVTLESVARISVEEGPSEIRRVDQRRVAVITANVEGRDLGSVTGDIEARLAGIPRSKEHEFILAGQQRELYTSYRSLQFALLLAIFLVYAVMACQFESIHQPALVMFSVPLAFVGVVYVLYAIGISVSIVVFIGGIVLAGIVVNNAIILVDYINQLRRRGLAKREAVIQGARVRLRPILMTALTTILGLIPMAIQSGEGAEIRQPLAITIMAGLSSATVLTLVIIPVVYDLLGGRDILREGGRS